MLKFKKKKMNPNSTDTLIGEGTAIDGRIKSEAGIRIEGQLTGDVESMGDVTIGATGLAHSNIKAREIFISGTVYGNITTEGKIAISPTGKLFGNISCKSFVIEEGAVFQGMSKMESKSAAAKSDVHPDPGVKSDATTMGFSSGGNSVAM